MRQIRKNFTIPLLISLATAVLSSCLGQSQSGTSMLNPENERESDALYTLPGLEHGLIQSPVNILTSRAAPGQHRILFRPDGAEALDIAEIEHSVRLDFTPGATTSVDRRIYDFIQCHFHTPSEHQINGVTYPMELHCVNKLRASQDASEPPRYLVVAFLFEMGSTNPFVDNFLDRIPGLTRGNLRKEGGSDGAEPFSVSELGAEIRPDDLYYFYEGSLTTPPYTESVEWHVLARIFEASPEQIQIINRFEGNNARRIHMLRDRVIGVSE